jgi:hypothetical protein
MFFLGAFQKKEQFRETVTAQGLTVRIAAV